MAAPVVAPPLEVPRLRPGSIAATWRGIRPVWSVPAAKRAVRAAVVIPSLFALSSRVMDRPQVATFAAFGGFATLVLAGFGGGRREKLMAHLGLAVAGSVLLVIGTAVNSVTWLAALVTLLVAFCVLFAGAASANTASGATAALLAYVLPAASPGHMSMIPDRLAGWWMASIAGTIAVLVLYSRPPTDGLRNAASRSAAAMADQLDAALAGSAGSALADATIRAKQGLLAAFTSVPYRPTGLTVTDQAIANLVEALQWCTAAVVQAVAAAPCQSSVGADRERLARSAAVLRLTADLVGGGDAPGLEEAVLGLDSLVMPAEPVTADERDDLHQIFHSRLVAAASRNAATDALIASRRIEPSQAAGDASRWWGQPLSSTPTTAVSTLRRAIGDLIGRNTNVRSIWFLNSARGALALAAAVAIADVSNVQHGFWVVLGALSVLRTSAASTGATALRALAGAAIGFVIGAAVILGIGHHTDVLWAALPIALLVAAYAPGTAPFAVGQAAFTVTITVLYNLIAPVGWKVGELRVEDVALGAAVSAVAGALFWPRGASRVVADDLAEAFHSGGVYLVQSASWALGLRDTKPDGATSVLAAGTRLDDALRALLTEQGTQRVPKEDLWHLAGGALRLRLMAHAMSRSGPTDTDMAVDIRTVMAKAVHLAGRYDELASQLGHTPPTVAEELARVNIAAEESDIVDPRLKWVELHLSHLALSLDELTSPAATMAAQTSGAWWR